jgi:hypothetical protein
MAGRLRIRQSGQAGGYRVRTGSKTRRTSKLEVGKRQELTGLTLVSLTNKTNRHR